MPMHSLSESCAFCPGDTKVVCEAFDSAWRMLEKSGVAYTDGSETMMREKLAKRILETAHAGLLDRIKLADDAVEYILRNARGRQPVRR